MGDASIKDPSLPDSGGRPDTSDLRNYATDETLRDGGRVRIRSIRANDKLRLLEHFRKLSPCSVRLRFFGQKRTLTEKDLIHFTELDFVRHVGLVATVVEGGRERIIGVGRYIVYDDAGKRAEVAFAVDDDYQGRGVATLLLEHLAQIAQANDVLRLEADVLSENRQMLEVFAHSGLLVHTSSDAGVVRLSLVTEAGQVPCQPAP